MPEKDPENIKWLLGILAGLFATLYSILAYRVFDVSKSVAVKVGMKTFNETIDAMRKETKEDFRYHTEEFGKMLKSLAKDLKDEIRSAKK
jgi:uncharacterized membrane protein (DUF106 family)